ncbi:hypothetical protein ACFRIC_39885 [Streptomyces sp. NPDC056738]|uniref:hypothetical protein n=1 Tax=Streptomyces sp. NPDC056738 TaxID=3345933 RepID=UPI003690C5B9
MFDDLPPDLARLLTLRVWHAMWLQRIDTKIAALQQREAEQARGHRTGPQSQTGSSNSASATAARP